MEWGPRALGSRSILSNATNPKMQEILNLKVKHRECYDKKTEILTSNGFKLIKNVTKKDLLATFNPKTKTLEYHKPTAIQKIRFKGKLINFKSKSYNLLVTPDHKIWCKKTPRSPYLFVEAEELVRSKTAYSTRLSCYADNWIGKKMKSYTIPAQRDTINRSMSNSHQKGDKKKIPMEKWIEFIGWYISEGSMFKTSRNYIVTISQHFNHNKNNFNRIVSLTKDMGFIPYFTKDKKEIRIFSKQLYKALKKLFAKGAINKRIPPEFKQLSKKHLKILYETLMKGDGDYRGNRYTTKSKQLADDFCELLLKLSKSGTVSHDSVCYRISISDKNAPQLGNNRTKKLYVKSIPYDGYVYDVTVQNHLIFVRRNGKACWSSNCYGERQNIGDKYRNVIGIFMNQIMQNKPISIFGDGEQTRAFSYISDIAPIIVSSIDKKEAYNQIFNIGADEPYTVNHLADTVRKAMGLPNHPIKHLEARKEVKHAHSDHKKVKEILGYKTTISLIEGIETMAAWAKKAGIKTSKEFDSIEVDKNMPPSWKKGN